MELQITYLGCLVPKTYKDAARRIRQDLMVTPSSQPQQTNSYSGSAAFPSSQPFAAYLDQGDHLVVPEYYARNTFPCAKFTDCRLQTGLSQQNAKLVFRGQLKESLHQPEAARVTLNSLTACGGAVLSLKVGMGKTCTALYIASQLKCKTLVLVHTLVLAEQWLQRIGQFVPGARVSQVQGSRVDLDGDFVVATIQSVLAQKKKGELKDLGSQFKMVIVDECHHIAAKAFSQVNFGLNVKYKLGLSATPTRKDGLQKLIHYFLGPIAFQIEGQAHIRAQVEVMEYVCDAYKLPPPVTRFGTVDHTRMINLLAENSDRSEAVCNAILALAEERGRHILVLSHRRAHCELLTSRLQARGVDAGTYIGGLKRVPSSQVIVSTYSLVSEGFDEPRLNTLVLVTPASDVEQTVGRILRGGGGSESKETPKIVDILDAWGVCYAQASKRRKVYLKNGFGVSPKKPLVAPRAVGYSFLPESEA